MSVTSYFTKLRGIWVRFNPFHCNSDVRVESARATLEEDKEKEHVYEFLMGLNEEFGTVRTQILNIKPMPTLGAVYRVVAEDEQQRSIIMPCKAIVKAATYKIRGQTVTS